MRRKKGVITSAKMTGTVTVTTHRAVFHPLYRKRYRVSKKFLADTGDFKDLIEGDEVVIVETRPLSKKKCFRVEDVVRRAPRVSDIAQEEEIESVAHREKVGADEEAKKAKEAEAAKEEAKKEEEAAPSEEESNEAKSDTPAES